LIARLNARRSAASSLLTVARAAPGSSAGPGVSVGEWDLSRWVLAIHEPVVKQHPSQELVANLRLLGVADELRRFHKVRLWNTGESLATKPSLREYSATIYNRQQGRKARHSVS
jgi:hypothetical protein